VAFVLACISPKVEKIGNKLKISGKMQNSTENNIITKSLRVSLSSFGNSRWHPKWPTYSTLPKQVVHQTHGDNFVSTLQIFKILSLLKEN